jgi:hypothetical protein
VSTTPTEAPPAWLEDAAKLDSLAGDDGPPSLTEESTAVETNVERKLPDEAVASRRSAMGTKPRPRITPPAIAPIIPTTEEVDLAWHGYSAAALAPSTLALAAVTCGVILILRPLAPLWVIHESVDAPLAALWLLQAVRAVYRLLGYNYRLTTRRVFCDRGRLYPPQAPVDLATVIRAEARQSFLGRLTGIGTVRIVPEDSTPIRPPIDLIGVRRPKVLAARIEEAAQAAREVNVMMVRMPAEPR